MRPTTTIVCVVAILAMVIGLALVIKGNVKASSTIGPGSFAIEASAK